MFEEYDPDNAGIQNNKISSGNLEDRPRVAIDDRRPYSESNPKYPEKYKRHLAAQVPMMLCPECRKLGLHVVQPDDQPTSPGMAMIGGEICDICGGGNTYEWVG